jgi:hypothetical protein
MKFLKHNAPESRVFSGRDSKATMLSRRSENPGFFSSALRAISAVLVREKLHKNFDHERLALLMLPMI